MEQSANRTRLAKNSLYMYIRMILTMIISLYSSRVLLRTIGVEDFGIYNVVGSVITMVSMLQSFFSLTTQRFLNYEMGKGNLDKLQIIFNMSLFINIIISVLFIVVVEIVGYYFLMYEINVEPDRLMAAKWVFQLSVISAVIMIVTSPFEALVIANESFNFYAFISILKSILSLIIIFIIPFGGCDKLISYAFLLMLVQVLVSMVCSIYCKLKYSECQFRKCWDKQLFRQIFSFAGWQLLGTSAYSISQSGLNLLFNVFGGPIVNAARGIAFQVNGLLYQFTNNISVAITPYSIKANAQGNVNNLHRMFYFSSKVLFIVASCVSIPLIYLSKYILRVWLDAVPEYTVGFISIVLLCSVVRSVHNPIDVLFKAEGKIKHYQIAEGIILSMPLVCSYFLLREGFSVYLAFFTTVFFEVINLIVVLIIANRVCNIKLSVYFSKILSVMVASLFIAVLGYYFNCFYCHTWYASLIIALFVDVIVVFLMFRYSFVSGEKDIIGRLYKQFLGVIKK